MVLDRIKVAIVDDNREFVDIMAEFLSRHSDIALVGTAYDGEGILAIITEHRPDVVILDLVMPHLDGIGVLERINELNGERPKVLVLTVFGQEEIMRQVIRLGADYYLLKPCNLDVLLSRVRQLAGEAGPSRPAAAAADESRPLDKEVTDFIREIGVPAHIKGYYYVRDAIILVLENDELIGAVTKELYPLVAARHDTTAGRVERAIRNCIGVACRRGNINVINRLFGPGKTEQGITNSEFIATVADRLKNG
ncbi:MAG: sporulation transcription factor Spo0A [Negativicutes bacterium]|nr:sporulation transcription factor Spo0A [Negativicutes bacterium]